MKFPSLRTLSLALLAALFLPACSGGGDKDKGDQFVSVNAFKSGSSGFYFYSSPVLKIVSNGPEQGISNNNPVPKVKRPTDANSDDSVGNMWADFAGEYSNVDEGYSDGSCQTNVAIYNSSDSQYSLSGTALYAVSGKIGYMELAFNEITSSTNVEFDAIVHFLGAATANDLQVATNSSTDTTITNGVTLNRVVLGSLRGAMVKIWFNYETNQALVTVEMTVAADGQNSHAEPWPAIYCMHSFARYTP